MDAVAEVKARLNIEDVISEYVQLKRAGRNFKGLSPWTNEKTPSFMVSPEKQIWHDFSSGKGGDIFSFVMEAEGLDFKAALEMLARKAGVDLDQLRGASNRASREIKNRSYEALELAAKFYQKQLTVNQIALSYLIRERGFSKKTLLTWQIGYSPGTGHALTNFLTKQGFTTDEAKRAGLSILRSDKAVDMFRGRIMIPLADSQGRIVGFTARLLANEPEAPKYINTPATLIYDKSRHVFGLHLAKEAIRKAGFVVVVEGNLDVISSHQAGITNVVASAGTAMTESHLRELKRFSGDIRLCFDTDSAGLAAAERIIPLAQKAGVNLQIINIQKYDVKDPDELIRKDIHFWNQAIAKPQYAADWLIGYYKSALDLKTAQGKKAFSDALLPTIRRLTDPVEQEHYLKKIADLTDTSLEAMKSKFGLQGRALQTRYRQIKPSEETASVSQVEYQRLKNHLLAIMFLNPKLRNLLEGLSPDYFDDELSLNLYKVLESKPNLKADDAVQNLQDYVKIITLQYEELYEGLPAEEIRAQALQLKSRLVNRYVKMQKQALAERMSAETDENKLRKLIQEADKLNKLIKERL